MNIKSLCFAAFLVLGGVTGAQAASATHGVVTAVEQSQVQEPQANGNNDENNLTGTAIGAAAGALLGRSVSGKHDKTKGTLIGGIVGGIAGNQTQKYLKDGQNSANTVTREIYRVDVKFDDGHVESYRYDEEPDFRTGDRVKLKDGRLRRE